jgi:hypothetical protein
MGVCVFGDVTQHPCTHRSYKRKRLLANACENEYLRFWEFAADMLRDCESVAVREKKIRNDDIGPEFARQFECTNARIRLANYFQVRFVIKHCAHTGADDGMIVD